MKPYCPFNLELFSLWTRTIRLDIPRSLYVGPLTNINTTSLLGRSPRQGCESGPFW